MKDSKKQTIRDTTKDIMKLPEEKRNFILGVMNGMLISFKSEDNKQPDKEPVA